MLALTGLVVSGVAMTMGAAMSSAQTGTQAPAGQSDNPFPGATDEKPAAKQAQQPGQAPAKPAATSDNPFPGEDSNAPILPVDGGPAPASGQGRPNDSASSADGRTDAGKLDPDGDPVRSPDQAGGEDDGFSSSRSGLKPAAAEAESDARPGSTTKPKTREQAMAENVDVGNFYLSKKNWKAAQGRFQSAFELDAENADAVWGLAEAERHLQLNEKAREHYKLFLSYDPDGPHGRAARKALQELEAQPPNPPHVSN